MHSSMTSRLIAFTGLLLLLSACNLPARRTPTPKGLGPLYTAAAETEWAKLTVVAKPPPTLAPLPTQQIPATPSPGATTAVPSLQPTTPTSQTTTPVLCDQAKFIKDVSVPDNTVFEPGTSFIKTWRLQNSGSCTWGSGYAVAFDQGDKMGAPDSVPLPSSVAPGQSIDVSVSMQAPDLSDTYQGDWKLRNASNQVFGIGSGSKPFWVKIKVAAGGPFDFVSSASQAAWKSGVGNDAGVDLTFNGPADSPEGAARIEEGVRLENGLTSGKLLLTYPKREENGFVTSVFSPYLVQPDDHFKVRLGFIANPDGSCGSGRAVFQVAYKTGDQVKTLGEWEKKCNGSLLPVDIPLTKLEGKTVQFIFTVLADGPAVDDWAVWNSPIVTR